MIIVNSFKAKHYAEIDNWEKHFEKYSEKRVAIKIADIAEISESKEGTFSIITFYDDSIMYVEEDLNSLIKMINK